MILLSVIKNLILQLFFFCFVLRSTITQFTHHTLFLKTVTVIHQVNYVTLEESFFKLFLNFFMQNFNCNCRPTTCRQLICLSAIILHAELSAMYDELHHTISQDTIYKCEMYIENECSMKLCDHL